MQALGWRSAGRYLPLRDDIASTGWWYGDTAAGVAAVAARLAPGCGRIQNLATPEVVQARGVAFNPGEVRVASTPNADAARLQLLQRARMWTLVSDGWESPLSVSCRRGHACGWHAARA